MIEGVHHHHHYHHHLHHHQLPGEALCLYCQENNTNDVILLWFLNSSDMNGASAMIQTLILFTQIRRQKYNFGWCSSRITWYEHFSLCCCWCLLSLLSSPFLLQLHHLLPSHFIALSSLHLPPLFHRHAPFLFFGKSVHGEDGPFGTLNYTQVASKWGKKCKMDAGAHSCTWTDCQSLV